MMMTIGEYVRQRNEQIKSEYQRLRAGGIQQKVAFIQLSKRYSVCEGRLRQILYGSQNVNPLT